MEQVSKERSIALQVKGWNIIQMAINRKEGHTHGGSEKVYREK